MYIVITIIFIIIVFFILVKLRGGNSRVNYLKSKAKEGDLYQQIALAKYYIYPEKNVEKNYQEAQFWLEKAILQESGEAAQLLGEIYCKSENPDYEKAMQLFQKAIEDNVPQSHIISCFTGLINHHFPQDTNKNKFNKFLQVLEIKAKENVCFAQFFLGEMYNKGMGVPINLEKAVDFYEKAASQDDLQARYELYRIYYYNTESKFYDLQKAFTHLVIAARGRCQTAYNLMIDITDKSPLIMYHPEIDKALNILLNTLLNLDKNENDADLKVYIGYMYANGCGVEENPEESFLWFKKAALQGNKDAQIIVGKNYEHGYGVKKDLEKAFEWYMKADVNSYAARRLASVINENRK